MLKLPMRKKSGNWLTQARLHNLCIQNYTVVLSDSYHDRQEFKEIYQIVKSRLSVFSCNPYWKEIRNYTEIQISGMKYLYDTMCVRAKCGWINSNNTVTYEINEGYIFNLINERRLNEFFFDSVYRYVFPEDIFTFIYVDCGRDVSNGNGVVPYSVDQFQIRPILNGKSIEEYVNSIPNSKAKSSIIKNWGSIIEMFENLFYEIPIKPSGDGEMDILKKLDYIQEVILFS